MRIRIKFNTLVAGELGLIFLLWLVSVLVSMPVFNKPFNSEWLTTHTLVSMRAFEEWGFWKLLGASVLIPKSYEFLGSDITTFTKAEGIYLSYPSLWLILPYVTFKLLKLVYLNISLSVSYLQIYNLILNRLVAGIVIYYIYLEIIKIITGNSLANYKKRIIAFLGLLGWMFTPPVMYWTQNIYFTDQAVLLPIYVIFLISLKCKFKFKELSKFHKALLFTASFFACGFDWYGWISVIVVLILVLINEWVLGGKAPLLFKVNLKQYLNSTKFISLGMLMAGLTFLVQILYYKDGLNQILATFMLRSSAIADNSAAPSTQTLLSGIIGHWLPYFPQILSIVLKEVILSTFSKLDINSFIIILLLLVLLSFLYYFYKQSENRQITVYVYVLIFLVPLFQIYFLRQHSLIHLFSAFKMGLPIAFSLLVLPAVIFAKLFGNTFGDRKFGAYSSNAYFSFFVLALGLVIIASSRSKVIEFAGVSNTSHQDLGFLVSRNIAPQDLPIADKTLEVIQNPPKSLVVGPQPQPDKTVATQAAFLLSPEPLWYTKRSIYAANQLTNLHLIANPQNLKSMKPVFLAYKDVSSSSSVSSICQGQWIDLADKVGGREVVACRSPKLRHLLDEEVRSEE